MRIHPFCVLSLCFLLKANTFLIRVAGLHPEFDYFIILGEYWGVFKNAVFYDDIAALTNSRTDGRALARGRAGRMLVQWLVSDALARRLHDIGRSQRRITATRKRRGNNLIAHISVYLHMLLSPLVPVRDVIFPLEYLSCPDSVVFTSAQSIDYASHHLGDMPF
jgi:hypothetical protein